MSLQATATISTNENPQFRGLPVMNGWSNFTRSACGSSATSIFETVLPGTFLEIKDNKFKWESLIVLRRTDFERLVKYSTNAMSSASRVKKILISITATTQSYSYTDGNTKAEHLIKAVSQQASLALELASVAPVYESQEKFFNSEVGDAGDGIDDLPVSRTELMRGIKKR